MPINVAILGASGGIGQPLSLLCKRNHKINKLTLFDVVNTPGVAADLSHINTPAQVEGYLLKDDGLRNALTGANIVIIPAGVPRKPGMTRDHLFGINAGIVRDLATGIADFCPKAFILVISNPVNSTVPIVAEVLKKKGVFDPKRLFGVTTLDVVRASTFVSEANKFPGDAHLYKVPVIGGHSGETIVPLLSKSEPKLSDNITRETTKLKELVKRIQFGGDEVVAKKDGTGSATLSVAEAGYKFAEAIIEAVSGKKDVIEHSYVCLKPDDGAAKGAEAVRKELEAARKELEAARNELEKELSEKPPLDYFSVSVKLGPDGIEEIYPIGFSSLPSGEKELVGKAVQELEGHIAKGKSFPAEQKL